LGPIDHHVLVRDPEGGPPRAVVCFDSNSYLGLHLHPRVVGAVRRTLDEAGYGTPSAQLLAGTNRWLVELEQVVAAFHGRPAAMIFPSGYAANVGTLTALLRRGDLCAWDRLSHASVQDGARWSGAELGGAFAHRDDPSLERLLAGSGDRARGKLVVSDGVFSMHGHLARLPELRRTASRHGARLMLDEAHSVGVVGPTGRGLEEHFGMPGAVDVLMGTFSKAPGAAGGYVCGSRELVDYLRFFARAGFFTASLPAPLCAGLSEAFRVMDDEPEHRVRLWERTRALWRGLVQVGFRLDPLEAPILAVPVGELDTLLAVGRELLAAGLKVGSVSFPAVAQGQSVLRLSVNARHTAEDVDFAVETLERVGRRHGIVGRKAA
jgi:glycine C-acetyltransferase